MGVLVGRETSPVEFDTGWFQERLAVIFEESEIQEIVSEKPELDFYAALQKSDLHEDYDLKINKTSVDNKNVKGVKSGTSAEESADSSISEIQSPLKKSRKAMTKLLGKQIASATVFDNSQKNNDLKSAVAISSIALKADKTKITKKIIDMESSSKAENQLPEIKSEQVKEYADKVYSYTIQIASLNSEADAMNHIAKLAAQGHTAYKSSGMVGDKTWYRIRIGNFNNITEAKESLKNLESKGIKGLIIQKD